MDKREKIRTLVWFLFWAILSTAWCWSAAYAIGPTFDEPAFVRLGLLNWHNLSHRELLCQGAMPLPTEVQTFPVYLAEMFAGADPAEDFSTWLPIARMGTAIFWWMLLWGAYRLASIYGGVAAGCLIIPLVACEPVLLGHASLATSDLGFTACLLGLTAVFRAHRDDPDWKRRIALPVFWCLLTYLAKASALVFVPITLGLVELERLWSAGWRPGTTRESWKPALNSIRELAIVGLTGFALLFVVCPRAWRGLSYQMKHVGEGHGITFLLGDLSDSGFRYYFAAALVIKLGVPILLLLAALCVFRPRHLWSGAFVAAAVLIALTFSPLFRVQIGVRHVFPIALLAMVAAAVGFGRWWHEQHSRSWRIASTGTVSALVLWSLVNAVTVWPHGICFTNELWGGTSRGWYALADSNYDWGQGLMDLARWQEKHPEAPLNVWYFGTDTRLDHLPMRPVAMFGVTTAKELEEINQGCFLAVSTNYCIAGPVAEQLRQREPCGRTLTYFIYDFRQGTTLARK